VDEAGISEMRILITQETDWILRNPGQQHHLAEMMSLRGHEVRAIDYELLWKTRGERGIFSRRSVFDNIGKIHDKAKVTVIRPGIVKIPWLDYLSILFSHKREIDRQIREFAPDVIVGFGILNSLIAAGRARAADIPFIYYWIDVLHDLIPFKPFRPIGRMVERKALKLANRIITINERLREYVSTQGADPNRTEVLGAGIDIDRFKPTADGRMLRERYGFRDDDIVLFFMGWLYHFSGLKEVALKLAQTPDHKIRLLIVGDGDANDELARIQQENDLQDKLILAGKRTYDELPAFIAACDVCLLPAHPREPVMQHIVPIKMYEYMAMGKSVIATRLPGVIQEFGEDNGVVYVDTPGDVIEKAAELFATDKQSELGTKARRFTEERSWERVTDEFENFLTAVLREKRDGAID
jgi:glycosyltransferase involved in cell wall biosynthesis